ncbi:MAG: hypothetical protein KatS3mg105_3861 [Gemmatales bacterium]|nr:MAG: hypothetical protein KatS3mg105_3861 [Gemmatales bacterium]
MRVPRSRSLFGSMLALAICHLSALPLCAQQTELQRVTFRVFVPQADAKLYVFDKLVSSTGEERELQTPLLDPTKTYFYEFKVFWEPNNYTKITRRKRVEFTVGKEVTVDLRQANPKQPDDIKIRYVPTPYPVVNEMLRLGECRQG